MTDAPHNQLIVEQFTRQAVPFAQMHSLEQSLGLLMEAAELSGRDDVLDVACGPGLVACACAMVARHVTGIDLTPAMIEQAEQLQRERKLTNVNWEVGDVTALPFTDAAFSVVLSRYAFHHFNRPAAVLAEMVRVCRRGGLVVVADVFTTSDAQDAAYNRVEKLRDPSHARALRLEELKQMFRDAGVPPHRTDFYRFDVDLERLLQSSQTEPAAAEEVRRLLAADVGSDVTGLAPKRVGPDLRVSFPIVVLAGRKG